MPSAASKSSQPTSQVTPDLMQEPLKNAMSVLDKKLRNLEKRKGKLMETKKKAELGDELNDDQKLALENLALVENSLGTVKELQKNMTALEQEYSRMVKKEQKRAKVEQKDKLDSQCQQLAVKVVEVQGVLGDLTEEIRPDFLSGSNGACTLTEDELANLDTFYELVTTTASEDGEKKLSVRVNTASGHLINLVQGKDKPAFEGVTYKTLQDIINRIVACGYFDKAVQSEEPVVEIQEAEEEASPEEEEAPATPEEESPSEEYPPTTLPTETAQPINGVDLPPEVQPTPEDEKIDFMGESEISPAAGDQNQPSLNPVSPVFVPRNMQQPSEEGNSGWGEPAAQQTGNWNDNSNNDGWTSVPDSHQGNQGSGGFRGRGRGRGGFRGNRGRGGNFRGGRQDGNFRGEYRGGNRGGRDGGNRGGNRGQRGGPRGGRGSGDRGGNRGGFGRPQQQQ